jgi:integrase
VVERQLPVWLAAKYDRAKNEWERMLKDCASLHNVPVATMTNDDIIAAILPHWTTKPITASRYLEKISKAMKFSISKGLRKTANPADWETMIKPQLDASPRQMQLKVKGQKKFGRVSLPHDEIADFVRALSYDTTTAGRAVMFAILTGGRSKEARLAEWSWYDEKRGLLNMPARVMKAGENHTVVLCDEAKALLAAMPRRSKYIFPSEYNATERDEPVTGHAMLYRVRKIAKVDVHGFRATFRNFAGAETDASFETAEIAIAHKVGNDTTRAYFNDPVFAKRAKLMAEWGAYACSKVPTAPVAGNVVQLRVA